ncbi:LacI family DNA-binding transcriptional regulator [Halalkalibacter kiskunsagensis]|uniref:LacI family DNA-binding transcriptional regulator n=1 Tax=Halalkalibacter kiskunsagensis TaxID=1548599 RepID=A0ABV6K742_9BACI
MLLSLDVIYNGIGTGYHFISVQYNINIFKSHTQIILWQVIIIKKVTIYDVAKHANVTKSTVSRVLNGSSEVSEKTKNKILETMDTLGFVPNKAARTLKSGKNNIIGLVVTQQGFSEVILNPFYPLLLKAITERAQSYGYHILLINPAGINYDSYIDIIKRNAADGFILLGSISNDTLSKKLDKDNIPYVFNMKYSWEHDNNYVSFDHVNSGYIATKYLLDLGHRNVKMIVGDVKGKILSHNKERIKGFEKALMEYNLPFDENKVLKAPGFMEESYNFIRNLYKEEHPTSLLLSNEVTAITAVNCLLDEGYTIPDDLSLISFGHIDIFKNVRPKLTTVHEDFEWQGKTLVDMLINRINNKETKAITKQSELIIGKSTGRKQRDGSRASI